MIRHYLKLMWNRKRSNLLVAIEIFLSFLVVFAVIVFGVHYADTWKRPLGFTIEDVWHVDVNMRSAVPSGDDTIPEEILQTYRELLGAIRELPEVVGVAATNAAPYGHSLGIYGADFDGWRLRFAINGATDTFASVMGLEITRGRWFDSRDDGASFVPVVINETLAAEIFHGKNPIGNSIPREKPRPGDTPEPEMRIVGVVRDFRQHGELPSMEMPETYLFRRHRLDDNTRHPPESIMIKLRPGTTAAFEEKLVRRMQAVARDWSFEVQPVEQMRDDWINQALAPLIGAAVIAGFLMLMVAMGLTGVLWQTVTQRTREVGLRRAKGATTADIRRQVFGELFVLTTVALVAGIAIVIQFPLLELMNFVTGREYGESLVVSVACIYLLTMACAWYPSRLATRIHPAEALHYE